MDACCWFSFCFLVIFFFKNKVSRYSYYDQFTYNTSINNWIQLQVIKISFALSLCSENAMAQQPRYFNPDKIPAIKSLLICHKEREIEILSECLHAITDFFADSALARIRTKISDACNIKKPLVRSGQAARGNVFNRKLLTWITKPNIVNMWRVFQWWIMDNTNQNNGTTSTYDNTPSKQKC